MSIVYRMFTRVLYVLRCPGGEEAEARIRIARCYT